MWGHIGVSKIVNGNCVSLHVGGDHHITCLEEWNSLTATPLQAQQLLAPYRGVYLDIHNPKLLSSTLRMLYSYQSIKTETLGLAFQEAPIDLSAFKGLIGELYHIHMDQLFLSCSMPFTTPLPSFASLVIQPLQEGLPLIHKCFPNITSIVLSLGISIPTLVSFNKLMEVDVLANSYNRQSCASS